MKQVIITGVVYSAMGYLFGSILFAAFFAKRIKHIDLELVSKDGNPGTANAFMHAGFLCGLLALLCDIGKGFMPVYGYMQLAAGQVEYRKLVSLMLIFVMIAPIFGHAYSMFHHFHGGKCIAVSFGVLLGLFPDLCPALILAFFYILFSILRIQPHGKRTFAAFAATCVVDTVIMKEKAVPVAMWIIACVVIHKHILLEKKQLEQEKEISC